MKALIFDSGVLINFSMNGLLDILVKLKKDFDGRFLITEQVKYEVVDRPIKIAKFELGALRINSLIEKKILEFPESFGLNSLMMDSLTKELMFYANNCVFANNRAVTIVSAAEMSCLALSRELNKANVQNIIAIDERTTRVLIEEPRSLEELMASKLHTKVKIDYEKINKIGKFNFIRSSEIVFVAYKKGFFELKGKKALEALLYATKSKGSSISYEEIEIIKKMKD